MNETKFYVKVVTVVKENINTTNSAIAVHSNKLLKLAYEATDSVLKEALLACERASRRVHYMSYGSSKWIDHRDTVLPACIKANRFVLDLVTSRMNTEKPEWQIIAEQNGWTPPTSSNKY